MSQKVKKLNITEDVLNLSEIKIKSAEIDRNDHVVINLESTVKEIPCHKCGKSTTPYGKSSLYRLRHLPICGRKTYLEIKPRRGRCPHCDDHPTTTEQPSWHERKSKNTKAYEQHVLLSLVHSTIRDVSIKEDIGPDSIQGIVDKYISVTADWSKFVYLGLIGIDEISLKKGHRDFITVITSRTESGISIVGVLKGREKVKVRQFFSSIPKRLRQTIIAVCTDMYDGYINAAQESLGQDIPVVIDRFHVAKLYRRCFVQLRKSELSRLRKTLTPEQYKALQAAITILCRNKPFETKEEKKILEHLFKRSPALKAGHKLCCQLTGIYNSHIGTKKALTKINEWIQLVESSGLKYFNTFVKTLKKYKPEILNYFRARQTSGFVEGINNKLKVLKRRCYGLFNINHFFQRAFLDISGYSFLNHTNGLSPI